MITGHHCSGPSIPLHHPLRPPLHLHHPFPPPKPPPPVNRTELAHSRIAVCLVGNARRFELTGPSIVKRLLKEYPNADVFLNSPFDENSYKLLVLKSAPQVVAVWVFEQRWLEETRESERVLSSQGFTSGLQPGRRLHITNPTPQNPDQLHIQLVEWTASGPVHSTQIASFGAITWSHQGPPMAA
ncbi:hypothetical protein AKJ16_DCAP01525 [Drosera capensis]